LVLSYSTVHSQACGEDISIVGSDYICEGMTHDYGLVDVFPGVFGKWSIDPPMAGTITTPDSANMITIDWTSPGNHQVIVSFTNYRPGCLGIFYDTLDVVVEDDFGIQLACNDTVQVSPGINCEALVTPDMVLEGGTIMDEDFALFIIDMQGDTLPTSIVDGQHVGQILQVDIYHICSGNYCSSWLKVEDKLDPSLDCTFYEIECDEDPTPGVDVGFPFSGIGTFYTQNPDGSYTVTGIDSCGDVNLTYVDDVQHNSCPPLVTHIDTIFRTWTAVDESGNEVSCVDTIAVLIGDINQVACPLNWDDIDQPAIDCSFPYPVDRNGNPHPDYTGYPTGASCSNIDFDYVDYRLGVCESSYKIIREWLIADWCTGTQIFCNQIIKVLDETGPEVRCPSGDTASVRPFECLGDAVVPNPLDFVIPGRECGSVSQVEVLVVRGAPDCSPVASPDETTLGVYKLPNGDYRIVDLPLGCNWVVYRYSDGCGNFTECRFYVFIKEDQKPIPVCDQHTTVTLSTTGRAIVYAETFDDGSYDNCELGHFEVRRMVEGDCPDIVADDIMFRDHVEFCCADAANSPVIVVMRVYDKSGNFNDCMVEVNVVDKNAPTLICPPHITVSCGFDFASTDEFGFMRDDQNDRENIIINDPANPNVGSNHNWGLDGFYGDDCEANLEYTENDGRNNCGVGVLTRRWVVSDANTSRTCTQRITFQEFNHFDGTGIVWPLDIDLNGCLSDTDPSVTGEPQLPNTDECSDLLVSYEDQVYTIVQGACYKILRNWTVVDWCNNNTRTNRWTNTQVIKIINTGDPFFVSGCIDQVFNSPGPGCSGYAELIVEVDDDCTPADELEVSYEIDLHKNGTYEIAQSGTTNASNTYDVGTHKICWVVEDKCGNKATCCYDFTIRDDKAPTPYCKPGIITVVMPSSGQVTIWASDLDDGSYDNCSHSRDLRFAFSTNLNDRSRAYDCSDIPNGIEETFEVEVYVTDEFGNKDYCTTTITIQDGIEDVCPDNINGNTAMLAGNILTETAESVEEVMVMLDGQMPGMPKYDMTSNDGHYAFPSIPTSQNYKIGATRNDDHMNGISTLDIVMIQRHLLGISSFNTPYKFIAADANNSSSVSAGDISELRKLILGYYLELPKNTSWRFVPTAFDFADPTDPWPFDEVLDVNDIAGDMMTNDFVAVKVGDVSGDAKANGLIGNVVRSNSGLALYTEDVQFSEGQTVSIGINIEKVDLLGLQYALQFDAEKLILSDIEHVNAVTSDANLGLTQLESGVIALSWNSLAGTEISFDGRFITLVFEAIGEGSLSECLGLHTKSVVPEAYTDEMEVSEISLNFLDNKGGVITSSTEFELLQNQPNPFDNTTSIGFRLHRNQEASIKVMDVTGKTVKLIQGMFSKGYNQVTVSREDLNTAGVLYYRLETKDRMATRKMILIE
jgi:hypothetical protein